ncbi:ASC-1 homology (ASCH) domain-containing protein [Lachnospiraceae bacterium XBD2001]|nr:ASC-1 homology (ASCH) domain-containing protein [Lachnospiraceae bacterium XBD2001]
MQLTIENLSEKYTVKRLGKNDISTVYNLCSPNTLYYEYCPPFVTAESIEKDMTVLPPGKTVEDKFYVGYFDADKLIAVMDLILGFPEADTAYIGFFMTEVSVQGKGVGSLIISELSRFISSCGYAKMQLGWVQGNPQPEHFWHKNGFCETGKTYDMDDFTVVEAQRKVKHIMQLAPSPFNMIKDGTKTIELRLYDEKRRMIHEGDIIEFINTEGKHDLLDVRVKNIFRYDSFGELYNNLPLLACGYTQDDISTASPEDMNEYYSVEEQEKYGVVGIEIEVF